MLGTSTAKKLLPLKTRPHRLKPLRFTRLSRTTRRRLVPAHTAPSRNRRPRRAHQAIHPKVALSCHTETASSASIGTGKDESRSAPPTQRPKTQLGSAGSTRTSIWPSNYEKLLQKWPS